MLFGIAGSRMSARLRTQVFPRFLYFFETLANRLLAQVFGALMQQETTFFDDPKVRSTQPAHMRVFAGKPLF